MPVRVPAVRRARANAHLDGDRRGILTRLSRKWSASISRDAFPVPPDATFGLYECGACGLHFFSPTLAGDAAFYQQLMATVPYETAQSRWEFGQVPVS